MKDLRFSGDIKLLDAIRDSELNRFASIEKHVLTFIKLPFFFGDLSARSYDRLDPCVISNERLGGRSEFRSIATRMRRKINFVNHETGVGASVAVPRSEIS